MPLQEQLLHVPVASLPPGLTSLRAVHLQLELQERQQEHDLRQEDRGRAGGSTSKGSGRQAASRQEPHKDTTAGCDPARLAAIFCSLRELEWTHGDHAAADRLLATALPHCREHLELLHISGPGETPRRHPCTALWDCLGSSRSENQSPAKHLSAVGLTFHLPSWAMQEHFTTRRCRWRW